jgi:hypothetical protein
MPTDTNVMKKEAEEVLKYESPSTEIHHMWKVKAKVIPMIICATGSLSR